MVVVDVPTGRARTVELQDPLGRAVSVQTVAFIDNRRLHATGFDADSRFALFQVTTDGAARTLVSSETTWFGGVSLSRDGRHLAVDRREFAGHPWLLAPP
jgi:hypothetical protein